MSLAGRCWDTWTGGICEGSVCTALKELQVWKNCLYRVRRDYPVKEWRLSQSAMEGVIGDGHQVPPHPHPTPPPSSCKTSRLPSSVCLLLSLKSWWSASLALINHELKNKTFSFHNYHGSVAMGGVFVWLLVMDKLHSSGLLQSWPARWRTPNMLVFNDTAVRESVWI